MAIAHFSSSHSDISGNIWQYLVISGYADSSKYKLTAKISELLSSIEASREVIESVSIPAEIETHIRRQSTLKSSLYSARIEGNTLVLDELDTLSSSPPGCNFNTHQRTTNNEFRPDQEEIFKR